MATKYTKIWKKDDKGGGKWVTIATTPSSTKEIITENPDLLKDSETSITAETALTRMEDKIEELQRNVSWLARYGGGGSGTGGGSGSGGASASIQITNTGISDNTLYVSSDSVEINYYISASRSNVSYTVNVILNGNTVISNGKVYSGLANATSTGELSLTNTSNTLIIQAEDEDGNTVDPVTLNIIKSSVTLKSEFPVGQTDYATSDVQHYYINYTVTTQASAEVIITITNMTRGTNTLITINPQVGSNIGKPVTKRFDLITAHAYDSNNNETSELFFPSEDKINGGSFVIHAIATANIVTGTVTTSASSTIDEKRVTFSSGSSIAVITSGMTDRNAAVIQSSDYYSYNGSGWVEAKPTDTPKITVYSELDCKSRLNTENFSATDVVKVNHLRESAITNVSDGTSISFSFSPVIRGQNTVYYAYYVSMFGNSVNGSTNIDSNGSIIIPDMYNNDQDNLRFKEFWDFNESYADGIDTGKIKDIDAGYTMSVGDTKQIKISVPTSLLPSQYGIWDIALVVAAKNGSYNITHLVCKVNATSYHLLSDPNPGNKRIAWWGLNNDTVFPSTEKTIWESVGTWTDYSGISETRRLDLTLKNVNGVNTGFITKSGTQQKIRLAGEGYGVINEQPFLNTTSSGSDTFWGGNKQSPHGFTISVTFKTDIHPYNNKTVFMCGSFSKTDSGYVFSNGIRITLEQAVWKYRDDTVSTTISCNIQQGVTNTIDFVYDPDKQLVLIYVNGVINAANTCKYFSPTSNGSSSYIYLACDHYDNGTITNFADVDFYDIKLFRTNLNDKDIVINYINSKARSSLVKSSDSDDYNTVDWSSYNEWRKRNFFASSINESTKIETWSCKLWDNISDTYKTIKDFSELANSSAPAPIVYLDFSTASGSNKFKKSTYETINASTDTEFAGGTMRYYDPEKGKEISTDVSVYFQGTSSTNYRSKNLEIKFSGYINEDTNKPNLFQPKEDWFPENQFTLKADVVDSSHANNASIGRWVNRYGDKLFDKTPPMKVYDEETTVIQDASGWNGDTYRNSAGNREKKETIKYTLEGFPIILLVRFYPEKEGETSEINLLGIYSFNLGRNSYYNMGFKFFKSFTTKKFDGSATDGSLPAMVVDYETTNVFGTNESTQINASEIFSYEIAVDDNTKYDDSGQITSPAIFSQDNLDIIKHEGGDKFRYLGNTDNETAAWNSLQTLFRVTSSLGSVATPKFILNSAGSYEYSYTTNPDGTKTLNTYSPALNDQLTDAASYAGYLDKILDLKSAYSYFLVCISFGLVDSLGKNMTLRCWHVNNGATDLSGLTNLRDRDKWYVCFYDMDTAFGLSNTGNEDVQKYVFTDRLENTGPGGTLVTIPDQEGFGGGYDTYSSRLWDILRNPNFEKLKTDVSTITSISSLWLDWRNNGLVIKENDNTGRQLNVDGLDSDNFINYYFKGQTSNIGELLYNADYREKYLTKYSKDSNQENSYANITFLHGTRTEFVRDWFRKRLYFLDALFDISTNIESITNKSPYLQKDSFSCGGSGGNTTDLTIRSNCPMIFTTEVGGVNTSTSTSKFFVLENEDTVIKLQGISSLNKQITINDVSQLSKLEGLKNIKFQSFTSSGGYSMRSLSGFDISGVSTLDSDTPVNFASLFVYNNDSNIRDINLSGTSFLVSKDTSSKVKNFPIIVSNYSKLKNIDISNSCVTALSLPSSSLSVCNIVNSQIDAINLSDQALLEKIDFTGCNMLRNITINNCSKITTLTMTNLDNLSMVSIGNCPNLTKIVCTDNLNLTSFNITGINPKLSSIDLHGCSNKDLKSGIDDSGDALLNFEQASNLVNLNLSGTRTQAIIVFPNNFTETDSTGKVSEKNISYSLDLSNTSFKSIEYGSSDTIPVFTRDSITYPILDLSPFPLSTTTFKLGGMALVDAIKFRCEKDKYTVISPGYFSYSAAGTTIYNNNMKRVFGNIQLTHDSLFGLDSFKVRENLKPLTVKIGTSSFAITRDLGDPSTRGGYSEKFYSNSDWIKAGKPGSNIELDTNIKFSGTDLSRCFSSTGCTLDDIYYVFSKIPNTVTAIPAMFSGCNKAGNKTGLDILSRDLFRNCTSVTNASSLFRGSNVSGILYSPISGKYPGILSPLALSGDGLNSMFYTGPIKYISQEFFHKWNSSNKTISSMDRITSLSAVFGYLGAGMRYIDESGMSVIHGYFEKYIQNNKNMATINSITVTDTGIDINSFKPEAIEISSKVILRRLPNLTSISHMFSDLSIKFDTVTDPNNYYNDDRTKTLYSYCPLFFYQTKLTGIDGSFLNITGSGVLLNVFGGGSLKLGNKKNPDGVAYSNAFPSKLSTMIDALIVSSGNVIMPLNNQIFERQGLNLTYISDWNDINSDYSSFKTYELGGISLNGFIKIFLKDEGFPYNIFQSNTNLKSIPGFMAGLRCYTLNIGASGTSFSDYIKPSEITKITLPSDSNDQSIFKGLSKVQSLARFFQDVDRTTISYSLVGKGFTDCSSLKSVRCIFAESDKGRTSRTDSAKTGTIPYQLFYVEKNISKVYPGWTEAEAEADFGSDPLSFGTKEKGFIRTEDLSSSEIKDAIKLEGVTDISTVDVSNYETGKIYYITDTTTGSNIYYRVGFYCQSDSEIPSQELSEYNNVPNTNISIDGYFSQIISDMSYALSGWTTKCNPYSISSDDIDTSNPDSNIGKLIIKNPKYNPVKYIKNSNFRRTTAIQKTDASGQTITYNVQNTNKSQLYRLKENPNYDPYEYIWDYYYLDGRQETIEAIKAVNTAIKNNQGTLLKPDNIPLLDSQYFITNLQPYMYLDHYTRVGNIVQSSDITGRSYQNSNIGYFCPPDIFKYCIDSISTRIDGVFAYSGIDKYYNGNDTVGWDEFGFQGRIPGILFKPVRKVSSTSMMFWGDSSIYPYSLAYSGENGGYGLMYPEDLFSDMVNLNNISGMFAYNYIPDRIMIPGSLFQGRNSILNASSLFRNTVFANQNTTIITQFPANVFSTCTGLINVSYMFMGESEYGFNCRAPKYMNLVFNSKNITNATNFFRRNSTSRGSNVPRFWDISGITSSGYLSAYAGCGISSGNTHFTNIKPSDLTNYSSAFN